MSNNPAFTESQKQYLSGLTFGTDVARAVRGLPVISGSGGSGTSIEVGGGGATVDGKTVPYGPEKIALDAQAATVGAGKKLCKEELAKQSKNPLDMWDEIVAWSDEGKFPKGDDVFLQKFHGLFHVAPAQNSYMMRLRIPGGLNHAWQLTGMADLADRSAGGYLDVTTRANLQFREIPADQGASMLYGIRELDVISLGSGGDNIRNCTASCLSGIDADELIETIPLAKKMHHHILNHREMYGLPRKFNIAFDGGGRIASLEDTNDIGFRAVRVEEDASSEEVPAGVYFQLTLGGITGHKDFARDTGVLLLPDECVAVAGSIVRVFVKHGDRTDRKTARLKYVLDDWGFDKFIDTVEKDYGKPLRRVDAARVTIPRHEDRMAHVGFHEQKQKGRFYVGVVLPVGRMTSDQARALAHIADEFGNGEVRWTVWQNLILPGIRERDVEEVQAAILACGLDYRASSFRAGLVACTGSAGCKYAGADTKANAMTLAKALESQFEIDVPINIHLTGCHHSCAQHYIGDIGLIACQVEQGDDMVDGYHVMVGGGWGDRQGIGRPLLQSVVFDDLPALIINLIDGYLAERQVDESFVEFSRRKTIEELQSLTKLALAQ
ncbi:NirA family protein [Allorhodopirellula solitaria]|uniref:Sulfite reductase [ferredoxin] n=1 Tax=Allorhodopirellula solitaria TaxID=2527987 RepID=A0A5C5WY86_9BACT|nr:NirA family protein [Allorhodopirellula solitaria]TWT55646.1 Sulfite reductase [ferredoxin] [Allorhodopirellula solitaria]